MMRSSNIFEQASIIHITAFGDVQLPMRDKTEVAAAIASDIVKVMNCANGQYQRSIWAWTKTEATANELIQFAYDCFAMTFQKDDDMPDQCPLFEGLDHGGALSRLGNAQYNLIWDLLVQLVIDSVIRPRTLIFWARNQVLQSGAFITPELLLALWSFIIREVNSCDAGCHHTFNESTLMKFFQGSLISNLADSECNNHININQ